MQFIPVRTLVDRSMKKAACGGPQLPGTPGLDGLARIQNDLGLRVNINLGGRRQAYDLIHVDDGPQAVGYGGDLHVLSNLGSKGVLDELVCLVI
jgi:hypothetical protein